MPLLRRRTKDEEVPRAGPYAPGWDVPARFNFTRDVVEALATDPLKPALTFVDREGIVDRRTFHEIAGDAARWAHLMRTRLDRGDRVVLAIGKVPSWQAAMLGALKSGLVAVPCPNTLRARDLAFRVRNSGARLVVADRSLELELEEMRNQVGASVSVLFLDEALEELRRYMPVAPSEDTTAGETALILYTSGTTQEPKGAVHTHAYTWAQRMQATHWLDAHEGDVVWCTADSGSAKAVWNSLLGPWSHGAEIVVHEGPFDAAERLSLIQRLGVTILCQTPTEYRMLAKLEKLELAYLPRLRHAVSAGEPLNPEVVARFQDALGVTVHDGYGQTENSVLVANTPAAPFRPGSMGQPTPGHDIAVIDDLGNVCPPGVEGDLALMGRPPTLFSGYWEATEEADALFRDDWFLTGDRATRDEDGYLWFVGRADDVIVSAAYRIGPFEVESALLEHAAVAESAVVGVPDDDRGQIVAAFVVLRPGQEPSDRLVSELQEHVKAVTAPYKYPREIAFVDELPKTASGKIQRGELRRLHAELAAAPPPTISLVPDPDEAPDPAAAEAAERARIEAERRARAEAAEAARREAEQATRIAAEAEAAQRARAEAEEAARLAAEAEAAERARAEAEQAARLAAEAEAAERARIEAEEVAAREAEAAAQREAEEAARLAAEAEAAERARAEAEQAARLAAEAEAAERARIEAEEVAAREAEAAAQREAEEAARLAAEAEAAERARAEAEQAARLAAEAEAAERARIEAEEVAAREAEAAAQRDAEEAAERARREEAAAIAALAAEPEPVEETEVGEASVETQEQSRGDARRRRREEKEAEKRRAEEERRQAKAAEEQRKRDEATAREEAKRREVEAKEAAKREAEDAKRREAEEREAAKRRDVEAKEAAKREAEDAKRREAEEKEAAKRQAEEARVQAKLDAEQRKRDEAAAREAEKATAKQREEDERRRQVEERETAKRREEEERRARREEEKARRGGGLGRLRKRGEPDEYDAPDDEASVEPISDIVERLRYYSRAPEPTSAAPNGPDEATVEDQPSSSQTIETD